MRCICALNNINGSIITTNIVCEKHKQHKHVKQLSSRNDHVKIIIDLIILLNLQSLKNRITHIL